MLPKAEADIFKAEETFVSIRTDPKPVNNLFSFFFPTLSKWSCLRNLSLNWHTCCLQTIRENLTSKQTSNSDTRETKMY